MGPKRYRQRTAAHSPPANTWSTSNVVDASSISSAICAQDVRRIGGPDAEDAVEHLLTRLEQDWTAG
ncbi:hypothetical protein [Agromyces bauzanensis]